MQLLFHEKVTARNKEYKGIHPIVAVESHQQHLGRLVNSAVRLLPIDNVGRRRKPDFVSVTRGPGMRSSLDTGLNTAKGLAAAWQIPLIGVNHMQAHALTPRLVSALDESPSPSSLEEITNPDPAFPFLSLLVSGGHTILVHSKGVCDHSVLASTIDIAIGDAIDKMAREVLPPEILDQQSEEIVYGRLLEDFAFPRSNMQSAETDIREEDIYNYTPPLTRSAEINQSSAPYGWALPVPLVNTPSGHKRSLAGFSFSGLGSAVHRICAAAVCRGRPLNIREGAKADSAGEDASLDGLNRAPPSFSLEERKHLARECQRVAFEHLASRVAGFLMQNPEINEEHDRQPSPSEEEKTSTYAEISEDDCTRRKGREEEEGGVRLAQPSTVKINSSSSSSAVPLLPRTLVQRSDRSDDIDINMSVPEMQKTSHPPPPPSERLHRAPACTTPVTPRTLVLSGGVASNGFLRHLLPRYLAARGFPGIRLVCPPVSLCTDNAAMIAWAGVEMWRAGWESEVSVKALRKWSLDPKAEDGGILGVEGWKRRRDADC